MAAKPSEILKKTKATDKKADKDDKKPATRSAMLDFIAKAKKA